MNTEFLGAVLGVGLIVYALTAGADFGAGFWSLWARPPHGKAQRELIKQTIAPVWEANHVWMIFVVVIAFTAFPVAFARAFTSLHAPLTLALLGLVVRGSAFIFHAYGMSSSSAGYHRAFEAASVFTPIVLGMSLAGLLRIDELGYFGTWCSAFGWVVGAFVLALFSLLAATYLSGEATGPVQELFRRRALMAEVAAGLLAYLAVVLTPADIETIARPLAFWPLHLATAAIAASVIVLLLMRRFVLARVAVIGQVTLVVAGYVVALAIEVEQRGFALQVSPELAAALVPVLAVAALILVPSLFLLYWVFRAEAKEP